MRGGLDEHSQARLVWLVMGLVIVPTLLLALYGAAAIRWQRTATESAMGSVRRDGLDRVAREFETSLLRIDDDLRKELRFCDVAEDCNPVVAGTARVQTTDLRNDPEAALSSPPEGEPTQWSEGPTGELLASNRFGVWATQWSPDVAQLTAGANVVGEAVLEGSRFAIVRDDPSEARSPAPLLSVPVVSVRLAPPFSDWRLTHRWTDDGPVGRSLFVSGWLLGLGLALLVGLVIVGTALALLAVARERRLSQLQTDFVSSVSHELRTPLTSIRLFVETLQSGRLSDPERIAECLDLLARETERLDRRIERVLGWARMEAGRRVYALEDVPVSQLVNDALAALRSQILPDTEPVEIRLPEGLPPVRVDHDAVVEALLNLLQNAVRHAPRPRTIQVEAHVEGKNVGIAVIDDGPGIPKRDRRRVFERFWQGDARLSAPAQGGAERGSGLGLAIVRSIARAHGGRVALDTELGRGSRFTLWLPSATGGTAEVVG